jgi:hypothetical protein
MGATEKRLALEIRTITASFDAVRQAGDVQEEHRRRARVLLDAVALRIDPERDPALHRLLNDARSRIER